MPAETPARLNVPELPASGAVPSVATPLVTSRNVTVPVEPEAPFDRVAVIVPLPTTTCVGAESRSATDPGLPTPASVSLFSIWISRTR